MIGEINANGIKIISPKIAINQKMGIVKVYKAAGTTYASPKIPNNIPNIAAAQSNITVGIANRTHQYVYQGNNPKPKGIPPRMKYVYSEPKNVDIKDPIVFNIIIYIYVIFIQIIYISNKFYSYYKSKFH